MRICFTGHRPGKLDGYDWNSEKNKEIIASIRKVIIEIYNSMKKMKKY